MSFRYAVQPDGELLVVVFEGSITPDEERQALIEIATTVELSPTTDILVDRRRARMTVGPEHVRPHVDLVREHFETETRARMALVTERDYDFGMARMLELIGGDALPHEFRVFRKIEEACAWLGKEPQSIVWP